jgi:hypothetical protein
MELLLRDNIMCRELTASQRNRSVKKRKQLCDITYAETYIMAANV